MIRVIVNGAAGHMGHVLTSLIRESEQFEIACLVDPAGGEGITENLQDFAGEADVLIDFSNHAGIGNVLEYCKGREIPAVIATTGFSDEELAAIREASGSIPVFHSSNMSLGIALLAKLVEEAASVFSGSDAEIMEIHHNRKLDAPSGTAIMLAEAIKKARPDQEILTGRSGNAKRKPNEIGISSLRMGNIVGTHEVFFSTGTQTITLKHEAHDRALFADGALSAAAFLAGKPAGLYNMNDLVG